MRRLPTERPPTHPGEMLVEEFLKPLEVGQSDFADNLGIPYTQLDDIICERRAVTPTLALRLARVLGMTPDFWLGLQQDWDLWHAMRSDAVNEINQLRPLAVMA